MSYDDFVAMAVRLPEVEEALKYRRPAICRKDRYMAGLQPEGDTISVKLDWDTHDRLVGEYPDVIYKTPHYEGWPAFLVRLDLLTPELAEVLLGAAWEDAARPSKRRRG